MADFLVGHKRKYTAVPKDDQGNVEPVDMTSPITWSVADGTFISLEADPDGNPLVNIGTCLAEGDTTVSCTFDADRAPGVPRNVTITSKVQNCRLPSATGGEITETDL